MNKDRYQVFLNTPFTPSADLVLEALRQAANALAQPVDVVRADLAIRHERLEANLRHLVAECDVVVADVSDASPNVFFELGLAFALDKPLVLITRDLQSVPSNLRGYLFLQYDESEVGLSRLSKELEHALMRAFKELRARRKEAAVRSDFPLVSYAELPFARITQAIDSAESGVDMLLSSLTIILSEANGGTSLNS